jgi:parallel beta-helix repeat protein
LQKTHVEVLLVILALSSVVPMVVLKPAFGWTGTVFIRADGSVDPSSSPLQRNGTLYTLTGNISSDYEAIVIEKDGVVVDGAGFTVQGLGSIYSVGVQIEGRLNVTVRRMRVEALEYGIVVDSSSDVDLIENVVAGNLVGVLFQASTFNGILSNTITDNSDGVELHASLNNSISSNFFQGNTRAGLSLCSSQNNSIVHNSFAGNSRNVDPCPDLLNVWNEGYPSGGNWWGNSYTGTDVCSGPYQNLTGSDGIGDLQYVIDVTNVDQYPLMGPWTDVGENITVTYSPQIFFMFDGVVSGGVLIVNLTQTGKPVPLGFLILGDPHVYYDVKTFANYSGSITMTLVYSDSGLNSLEEKNMVLVQWNNMSEKWENITVGADIMHNRIFGETSHLSVFTLIVPLLGDINKDGIIDIFDAIQLATAFGSTPTSPKWNPEADINKDDVVDIYDAIILSSNYGKD